MQPPPLLCKKRRRSRGKEIITPSTIHASNGRGTSWLRVQSNGKEKEVARNGKKQRRQPENVQRTVHNVHFFKDTALEDDDLHDDTNQHRIGNNNRSTEEDVGLDIPYAIRDDKNKQLQLSCALSRVPKEPIRPGDVISYYHPTSITGSKDGYRIAQVLATTTTHPRETANHPTPNNKNCHTNNNNNNNNNNGPVLSLDNGEYLPSDCHIRRIMEYRDGRWYPHDGITRPIAQFLLTTTTSTTTTTAAVGGGATSDPNHHQHRSNSSKSNCGIWKQIERYRQIMYRTHDGLDDDIHHHDEEEDSTATDPDDDDDAASSSSSSSITSLVQRAIQSASKLVQEEPPHPTTTATTTTCRTVGSSSFLLQSSPVDTEDETYKDATTGWLPPHERVVIPRASIITTKVTTPTRTTTTTTTTAPVKLDDSITIRKKKKIPTLSFRKENGDHHHILHHPRSRNNMVPPNKLQRLDHADTTRKNRDVDRVVPHTGQLLDEPHPHQPAATTTRPSQMELYHSNRNHHDPDSCSSSSSSSQGSGSMDILLPTRLNLHHQRHRSCHHGTTVTIPPAKKREDGSARIQTTTRHTSTATSPKVKSFFRVSPKARSKTTTSSSLSHTHDEDDWCSKSKSRWRSTNSSSSIDSTTTYGIEDDAEQQRIRHREQIDEYQSVMRNYQESHGSCSSNNSIAGTKKKKLVLQKIN
jgi:hypothetical protein